PSVAAVFHVVEIAIVFSVNHKRCEGHKNSVLPDGSKHNTRASLSFVCIVICISHANPSFLSWLYV
ncbi:MAG TPA: hypothetical protein VHA06_07300, partial [Candidatus Angelobacter sp.]|nr:hypothetical protein [Candidatus Angelobacter sp.]